MKFSFHRLVTSVTLAIALTATAASAAGTNVLVATRNHNPKPLTAKPAPGPAEVAPHRAGLQSSFVIPRKATEGRDPFFPNSTRVYGAKVSINATNEPSISAELTLKGISGTPEQPLAIINTTTFTTGESNEVLIKNGRLRVHCVEINMALGTVLLQIGAERRELQLAPAK